VAWEHFHTLADIPVFSEKAPQADAANACCAPASRGKVDIAVKPAASCCRGRRAMTTNVLILCTRNSARSVLDEGMLNHWAKKLGRDVRAFSEFAADGASPLAIVITVCDSAAAEQSPVFFGSPGRQPLKVHWGYPDPSNAEGGDEGKRRAAGLADGAGAGGAGGRALRLRVGDRPQGRRGAVPVGRRRVRGAGGAAGAAAGRAGASVSLQVQPALALQARADRVP
jgi:arsenate reductase